MSSDKEQYPNGAGNLPGGAGRQRRRGPLPGAEDSSGSDASSAPIGSQQLGQQQPSAHDEAGLSVTQRQATPPAKVWGLRVSEQHYDTANTMLNTLAVQFQLDKRQVGELLVQFLVRNRFDLFDYVRTQTGPAVDLDFFTRTDNSSGS